MKLFSLANATWCAVTVPSFDFVKDDCAVGSVVLGKKGYNLSNTQSVVLFHVELEFRILFIAQLYPIRVKGKYDTQI